MNTMTRKLIERALKRAESSAKMHVSEAEWHFSEVRSAAQSAAFYARTLAELEEDLAKPNLPPAVRRTLEAEHETFSEWQAGNKARLAGLVVEWGRELDAQAMQLELASELHLALEPERTEA